MQKANRGFTLIELMIVIVIISILVAFAYPSYRESILKSRRTDGQAGLLACAAKQEQWFTRNTSYADTATVTANTQVFGTTCTNSPENYYTISIANNGCSSVVGGVTKYSCYELTATAGTKGGQNSDTQCNTLTITQAGTKGSKDSGGTVTTTCWSR